MHNYFLRVLFFLLFAALTYSYSVTLWKNATYNGLKVTFDPVAKYQPMRTSWVMGDIGAYTQFLNESIFQNNPNIHKFTLYGPDYKNVVEHAFVKRIRAFLIRLYIYPVIYSVDNSYSFLDCSNLEAVEANFPYIFSSFNNLEFRILKEHLHKESQDWRLLLMNGKDKTILYTVPENFAFDEKQSHC